MPGPVSKVMDMKYILVHVYTKFKDRCSSTNAPFSAIRFQSNIQRELPANKFDYGEKPRNPTAMHQLKCHLELNPGARF
jgi:hypothetical protein